MKTNDISNPFWSAVADTENGPKFFHLLANENALFTSNVADTFRCTDDLDAIQLCEALEETDASGWRTIRLAEQTPVELPSGERLHEFWILNRNGARVGKLRAPAPAIHERINQRLQNE